MTAVSDYWWQSFRRIGDIRVFHVDLTPNADREVEAYTWLDGPERSRWERFNSLPARRRFVLCRAALRAEIARHLSCANEELDFVASEHGKPFARVRGKSACYSFNVSHSGKHGLIAIASDGRLGVDVEERAPRKNLDLLIQGVFSPLEIAELEQLKGAQKLFEFFRFWTIKEALVKAQGKGLSFKMAELEIPADMRHGATKGNCQILQMPNVTWNLEDISTIQFAAAVAHESESAS